MDLAMIMFKPDGKYVALTNDFLRDSDSNYLWHEIDRYHDLKPRANNVFWRTFFTSIAKCHVRSLVLDYLQKNDYATFNSAQHASVDGRAWRQWEWYNQKTDFIVIQQHLDSVGCKIDVDTVPSDSNPNESFIYQIQVCAHAFSRTMLFANLCRRLYNDRGVEIIANLVELFELQKFTVGNAGYEVLPIEDYLSKKCLKYYQKHVLV